MVLRAISLVALVACVDGGMRALRVSAMTDIRIPAWGANEHVVERDYPHLVAARGVEGVSAGWRYQTVIAQVMGVKVTLLSFFFERKGLSRIALDFSNVLDAKELENREALWTQLEARLGAPSEAGQCWRAWTIEEGAVVVEPGRVQLFSSPSPLPGVDRTCTRLVPLKQKASHDR